MEETGSATRTERVQADAQGHLERRTTDFWCVERLTARVSGRVRGREHPPGLMIHGTFAYCGPFCMANPPDRRSRICAVVAQRFEGMNNLFGLDRRGCAGSFSVGAAEADATARDSGRRFS